MNAVAHVIDELADIPKARSVEEYLNDVSYRVPANYLPSDFALGFVAFIKLINGEIGEENETPIVHLYMLDKLVSGDRRIANLCSRGIAKTTLFGEYLFLYLAVYGKLPEFGEISLALYVSDSIENGVKNMRKNLEFRWENSEFLQRYVPDTRFTDVRWEFSNVDGKILVVKAYGAKTGVRGAKEMGIRPQMAVLDDLVSDEDARSATVIASIEDTVYKAVDYALHPKNNIMIWSGTPFNARDPLYKAVESGAWSVNVFPVCEVFPCAKEDFISAWPDRFHYEYVLKKYRDSLALGKVDTFNQELMLRIMSDEDRMITNDQILWYSYESLLRNKSSFNYYITTDFATSGKQSTDFSVISVWGYSSNGSWYWVDGIRARQKMDKNINDLFHFVQKWNPMSVGVEVSGQQEAFITWIQNEMLERNVHFTFASDKNSNAPGIRPNTDKMKRFSLIQPMFGAHKMFFPAEKKTFTVLREGIAELMLIAKSGIKSKHDDFIDTVSMLPSIDPWKPSSYSSYSDPADPLWEESMQESVSTISSYVV